MENRIRHASGPVLTKPSIPLHIFGWREKNIFTKLASVLDESIKSEASSHDQIKVTKLRLEYDQKNVTTKIVPQRSAGTSGNHLSSSEARLNLDCLS